MGDFKQKQHYYVWEKMMKYDEDMIISTEQTIILAILVFENDRELIPVGNYKFQMPNSFLDLIVPIKVILRHVFANLFLLRQVCQSYL